MPMSQQDRDRMTLSADDAGRMIRNKTTGELEQWDGTAWQIVQTGTETNGGNF
jgi:hypothetical protein